MFLLLQLDIVATPFHLWGITGERCCCFTCVPIVVAVVVVVIAAKKDGLVRVE